MEKEDFKKMSKRQVWQQVKYVGWQRIPSLATRRLVFERAYESYDYDKNDCFVAYYSQMINYNAMDMYKSKRGILTLTSKAWAANDRKSKWPSKDDKPETQGENIIQKFVAKF